MRFATALLLGGVCVTAGADERAKPFPDALVKAWEAEGARAGRMPARVGVGLAVADPFQPKAPDAPGQLPTMQVSYIYVPNPNGGPSVVKFPDLSKLPAPEVPFGISETGWSRNGGRHLQLARFTTLELLDSSYSGLTESHLADLTALKNLRTMRLAGKNLSWAAPKALAAFPKLTDLSLYQTRLGDPTAELVVEHLPQLEALNIGAGPLTDDGLKALAAHKKLRHLHVESTQLTDAGLRHLRDGELRTLNLGITNVTDAGLKHVGGMKALESLLLYRTGVTDAGVAELTGLPNLRELNLHVNGRIGTDGLTAVGKMTNLEVLGIRLDASVGEATLLLELQRLKKLQTLYVNHPKLTAEKVERLQKALPKCAITWGTRDG